MAKPNRSRNNNNTAKALIYATVNAIPKNEVTKPEHEYIINNALLEVQGYAGLFDGETYESRKLRVSMDSAMQGEVGELAEYFKSLYPDAFIGDKPWAIVYKMYNRMKGLESIGTSSPDEESNKEIVAEEGPSDKENNNKQTEEDIIMSEVTNMNELDMLEKQLSETQGADLNGGLPQPGSTDQQASVEAAQEVVIADRENRMNYMNTAKVIHAVLAKPANKDILVDGLDAKGTLGDVNNVNKQIKNFMTKTGCQVHDDGSVSFTNVPMSSMEDAKNMYAALKAAQEDPTKQFKVYVNENATGTLKGVELLETQDASGIYLSMEDLINVIMQRSAGLLLTPDGGQFMLTKTERKASNKKKSSTKKSAKTKKSAFSGVASIRIPNKKDVLPAIAQYHKEKTNEQEILGGYKSDMKVTYYRGEADDEGNRAEGTYRIPLLVNQYKLEVTDERLKAKFGTGKGIGATVTNVDITDTAALDALIKEVANIVAVVATKNDVKNDFISGIRERVAAKTAGVAAEQADQIADANI